jgi:hypothetical protein
LNHVRLSRVYDIEIVEETVNQSYGGKSGNNDGTGGSSDTFSDQVGIQEKAASKVEEIVPRKSLRNPQKKLKKEDYFTGDAHKLPDEQVLKEQIPASWFGPPAEVNPRIAETNQRSSIIQAGAYAFHFLLRVFPMLKEETLLEIFPDRCVYTLVLSHQEVILIKVDVSRMVISGRPAFFHTDILTGKEYVSIVARWIKWATLVAMNLKEYQSELNEFNPKNCWVSASRYSNEYQNDFGDDFVDRFGILEPKPSFFNPIFKSKTRYYRIYLCKL